MFIKLGESYAVIYVPCYSSAILHTEMIMPQNVSFLMAVILADD